jgi:serine-type D-Ala-D-Ala carboxypeptidase/endopeptidase
MARHDAVNYAASPQGARSSFAKARAMRSIALAAVLLVGAPAIPAFSQTTEPTELQAALDARAGAAAGTGIALGIIDHGRTRIFVAGSAGNGHSVDEKTLFEIGSVTKTFTATALAVMTQAGQVRLDDPISEYLPAGVHAPSKEGEPITLLDLAEQRSGLPRLPTNMDAYSDDPYANYSLADMYAFLNGYTLTRDPGALYEYSNYGIGLLGQLLANRAGTSYPQLIRQLVLDPLAMTETSFALAPASDPAALAVGHDLNGAVVPVWHAQSIAPAGAILSNVDDMLKFLRCNMGLGPLAQTCLYAQQPRADGEPGHRIGLVWNINSGTGIVSHGGDTVGFHAFVEIARDRQTGVVALSNGPAVADIAAHILAPAYPIAACPTSVPASKTDPASYAGLYCNALAGITFAVNGRPDASELSIALLPQRALAVRRVDQDTYFAERVEATIAFVRQDDRIIGLRLFQGGNQLDAVRFDARGKPVAAQLPPAFPPVVALDDSTLRQYVGAYNANLETFTVTLRGRQLYVQITNQSALPVYAFAKDDFFYKVFLADIRFERDASGAVASLTLHQNGRDVIATRAR